MGHAARLAVAGSIAGAALMVAAPAASATSRFVGPGQSIQRAVDRAAQEMGLEEVRQHEVHLAARLLGRRMGSSGQKQARQQRG